MVPVGFKSTDLLKLGSPRSEPKSIEFLWVLLVYFACSLASFAPRWLTLSTGYGLPDVDMDGTLAYLWYKVVHVSGNTQDLITRDVGYPFGFDYTYLPFKNRISDAIVWFVVFIRGDFPALLTTVNSFILISNVLSGTLAYSLAREIGCSRTASLLAGICYGFSSEPVVSSRGVMPLGAYFLIPLVASFLLRFTRRPCWQTGLSFSLVWGLYLGIDSYYAVYSAIFVFLLAPGLMFYGRVKFFQLFQLLFSVIVVAVLLNIEYLWANLHLLNVSDAVSMGRNLDGNHDFIKIESYFFPSKNNILWGWIGLQGASILPLTAVLVVLAGLFFLRAQRVSLAFLGYLAMVLAVAIVLSTNIPGLDLVTNFYQSVLFPFRSVGRFLYFALIAVALLFAVAFDVLFASRKQTSVPRFAVAVVLFVAIALEGRSQDPSVWVTTDLQPVLKFHSSVVKSTEPYAILGVPTYYSGFQVGFYQRVGQIAHGAFLQNSLDPKSRFASISSRPENDVKSILGYAERYQFDTIYVHNRLLAPFGGDGLRNRLLNEPRLQFLGRFLAPVPATSGLYSSLDISVFRLPDVWKRNRALLKDSVVTVDGLNPKVAFENQYTFTIDRPQVDGAVVRLRQSFSDEWSIRLVNEDSIKKVMRFILGDLVSVIDLVFGEKVRSVHKYDESTFDNLWEVQSWLTERGARSVAFILKFGAIRAISDSVFGFTLVTGFCLVLFSRLRRRDSVR